mgnify:FL=1
MTNTNDPASGAPEDPQPIVTPEDAPHIQVHAQYIKDLSFENPEAPHSLANQGAAPNIEVSVDVGARNLAPSQFEVELRITAHATQGDKKAFVVEVLYAGVFTMHNVPEQQLKEACLIEGPRLLFPFARRIVADATRDGGFPPLLLEPIDFVALYMQSANNAQSGQNGQNPAGDSSDGK